MKNSCSLITKQYLHELAPKGEGLLCPKPNAPPEDAPPKPKPPAAGAAAGVPNPPAAGAGVGAELAFLTPAW